MGQVTDPGIGRRWTGVADDGMVGEERKNQFLFLSKRMPGIPADLKEAVAP